jgi:hypothetical protein
VRCIHPHHGDDQGWAGIRLHEYLSGLDAYRQRAGSRRPDGNSRIEEWVGQGNPENNAGYAGVVCQFFNNVSQGTWWMPVRTWWSGNGVGGYIWVQHLYWGHTHHCWTLFASYQAIPSGYCFLTNY